MQRSFFTSRSPGKPLRLKKNKWAFSPDPLPHELSHNRQVPIALAGAERAIGRVEGELAGLKNFFKPLCNIFLFQGASASFALEETKVTTESHFQFLLSEKVESADPLDHISLYCKAYMGGHDYLEKSLPPSLDLILQLNQMVFQNDRTATDQQNGFRDSSDDPASLFSDLGEEYQYIPPPEQAMKTALYSFDKRFRQDIKLPNLIDIALIFYQFTAIQPLNRGNWITACLLSDLLLANSLETRTIPISMAPFISMNKQDCANHFFHLIKTGDWDDWIRFFLKGIARQFSNARQTIANVSTLRDDYRKRLESERSSAALAQLADDIFTNPIITVNYASRLARITFRAAQLNVDKLVDLGILKETSGQRRNRVYSAFDVLRIYES